MKLRYPKTREEFNELVAYLNYKPPELHEKGIDEGHYPRNLQLFRKWPVEVQEKAKVNLAMLLVKHQAKLESKPYGSARNYYYGKLVGIATMMATRQLGICKVSWSDLGKMTRKRILNKSKVKTFIGLQEPLRNIGGWGTSRKNHAQKYNPNPQPNQVSQGDLTGI